MFNSQPFYRGHQYENNGHWTQTPILLVLGCVSDPLSSWPQVRNKTRAHTHQEHVYATCLCITWAATTGLQAGRLVTLTKFSETFKDTSNLVRSGQIREYTLYFCFLQSPLVCVFKPLPPAYFCCIRHKPSISLTAGRLLHVLICPYWCSFLSAQHVLSTKHISFLPKDIRRSSLTDVRLSAYGRFQSGSGGVWGRGWLTGLIPMCSSKQNGGKREMESNCLTHPMWEIYVSTTFFLHIKPLDICSCSTKSYMEEDRLDTSVFLSLRLLASQHLKEFPLLC